MKRLREVTERGLWINPDPSLLAEMQAVYLFMKATWRTVRAAIRWTMS